MLPQRANNEEKGIHPTTKTDWTEGFGCLGHSNWTICSLLSQFYFPNFTTFSLSYWRPILITPESGGLKIGKRNSHNLSGVGIQTGTFPSFCSTCVLFKRCTPSQLQSYLLDLLIRTRNEIKSRYPCLLALYSFI